MKKLLLFSFFILGACFLRAQQGGDQAIQGDRLFLAFDFMKVSDANLIDYLDVEEFWSKIHEQRVKIGEMAGWDFWSLTPGGQSQGSQFLTVQLFSSFEQMMKGTSFEQIRADAKKAYPKKTDAEIEAMIQKTGKSREINNQLYLERIAYTNGAFDMPVGTVCTMAIMKQLKDGYEQAESETFKPLFQSLVDRGIMGHWAVARILFPAGSDRYASHLTFNMFKDLAQYASYREGSAPDIDYKTQQAISAGLATRDMKEVRLMTLLKKVR